MAQPDPPARMPQVQPEEFTDETRDFFARWTGGFLGGAESNPVLKTFAHHPKLADVFSQFNIHLLLDNTLPVKQRQIAIMRTAWLTKALYMWSSHLNTSMNCGLSPEMFDPIKVGADDPWFSPFEQTVMRATDELVTDRKIGEASWDALMQEWDNQQMLDFMFTVGCYAAVAGVMRSTGAERDPDLLDLAEKYGAPEA
ncbi:MAG: carboxymuconolactone decarboxylase family protein [Novosphingobium sp.]|nr:carboxymuconolactone decarboxylase family protein [Novosphingobium sp.]